MDLLSLEKDLSKTKCCVKVLYCIVVLGGYRYSQRFEGVSVYPKCLEHARFIFQRSINLRLWIDLVAYELM